MSHPPRAPRPPRQPREPRPAEPHPAPPDRPEEPPRYTKYRAGPRLFRGARSDGWSFRARPQPLTPRRRRPWPFRGPLTWRKAVAVAVIAVVGWVALSLVLFLLSAWTQEGGVSDATKQALDGGGFPPFSATTILVLGTDQRSKRTKEPGACYSCPHRTDTMLLIRTGGGHGARLSIPRDTVVDIPGHGMAKINAAYAYGGAPLAIETVKQYLGIPINHVVIVNFDNFPALVDAMGGVDYTGGCVLSVINGGFRNGGYTLHLKPGTSHLNGKQALALARTRHNLCHPGESDLTRVQRQQQLFQAMKSRVLSFGGFIRLPWISWNAPPAITSDMGGHTLLGLLGGLAIGGSPSTHFLHPSGTLTLPDGGVGLVVSDAEKRREMQSFESG